MKKETGVTIVSLIMYVGALLIVAIIIGNITTFFYNNVVSISDSSDYSNAYSKINLSILSVLKEPNITNIEIGNYEEKEDIYTFIPSENNIGTAMRVTIGTEEDSEVKIIALVGKQIYLNRVLLGENITSFNLSEEHESYEDKENYKIAMNIRIGKESYTHTYTSIVE